MSLSPKHTCHWTGCTREVPPAMWGCREHWFKLPKELRDQIWKEYRPGQEIDKRPSERYVAVAALVQGWIAGKVEIRKDGSVFLTGDLQVGGHTLPVGEDGRLAPANCCETCVDTGPYDPVSKTYCPTCGGTGRARSMSR